MWICCCLILHNLIIEIKESLGIASTGDDFYEELFGQRIDLNVEEEEEEEGQGDQTYIGTAGQEFHNALMARLLLILQ
jgi:hypothetical protein